MTTSEESQLRVVLCWALDRVRRRTAPPQFERRLYEANSEQARFLVHVCAEAGSMALPFGLDVFHAAVDRFKGEPLDPRDVRGLVLGFHAKALDLLIGVRAVTGSGSLGPAMVAVRVLFETYVRQTYLLQADSHQRAEAYRKAGLDASVRDARERVRAGGPSSYEMDTLLELVRAKDAYDPDTVAGRPGSNVLELARDIGLGSIYTTLYRHASAIVHARDADGYNPIVIATMLQQSRLEQPYFLAGYGLWSAGDALALAGFLDTVPICLFGNTADFLQLPLDSRNRELVTVLRRVIHQDDATRLDDLRSSFPEIIV